MPPPAQTSKGVVLTRLTPILAAVILLLGACSRSDRRAETIRVATDASYRPFEYYDESRELVGFDIDLMRALAERASLSVEFINQPFDGIIAGLESGKYDAAISAMTITPERAERVLFSDPYYDAGQVVAVRSEDMSIHGFADLTGRRIGVQRGTTGALKARDVAGATLSEYDTIDLAFLALENGTVDAVINDELTSRAIAAARGSVKLVGAPLTEERYGIALRKDREELAARLNAALATARADGTLAALDRKWIQGP
ncbi:basic amino acid ABC transporter substrate-binding protein [Candidatus Poribacteria bacterium]|nr:basic amino acid ABC transporter substrate-binding protein [Candidatus Poribacteria bacterium]